MTTHTIRLGDSPYYVQPQFIINTLEGELVKRIDHKARIQDIFIQKGSNDCEVLLGNVNDRYSCEMKPNFITSDPGIINLYKAIKLLTETL